jgi:hypothetical protein
MRRVNTCSTTISFLCSMLSLKFWIRRGCNRREIVYLGERFPRSHIREVRPRANELKLGTKISLVTMWALPRIETLSDHPPILITTRTPKPVSADLVVALFTNAICNGALFSLLLELGLNKRWWS